MVAHCWEQLASEKLQRHHKYLTSKLADEGAVVPMSPFLNLSRSDIDKWCTANKNAAFVPAGDILVNAAAARTNARKAVTEATITALDLYQSWVLQVAESKIGVLHAKCKPASVECKEVQFGFTSSASQVDIMEQKAKHWSNKWFQ